MRESQIGIIEVIENARIPSVDKTLDSGRTDQARLAV